MGGFGHSETASKVLAGRDLGVLEILSFALCNPQLRHGGIKQQAGVAFEAPMDSHAHAAAVPPLGQGLGVTWITVQGCQGYILLTGYFLLEEV